MPNTVNQQRQLAALQSKQNKTQEDLAQITGLERKLATKLSLAPRPQRQNNPVRRKKVGVRALQAPQSQPSRPAQRDGLENQLTPFDYKRMLMSIDQRGSTGPGRAWAHLALHPPSAPPADFAGLPDYTTQPRVTPQFVTDFDVKWDASIFPSPGSNPVTYGVYMAVPDVPEIAACYYLADEVNNLRSDIRYIRTSTMTAVQNSTYHTYTGMQDLGYSMARITSSSITGIYTGTTLGDAGTIYTASISPIIERRSIANTQTIPTTVGTTAFTPIAEDDWDLSIAILPASVAALVQRDPAHYKNRAREGTFAVQKFDESLLGYAYSSCGSGQVNLIPPTGTTTSFGVDSSMAVVWDDTATSVNIVSVPELISGQRITPPSGVTSNLPTNALLSGLMTGVTAHSGMSWTLVYAVGLSIEQGESFSFSRRITVDGQVPSNSNLVPFIKSVPDWDEVAIKAVMHVQRAMPSGMPASCNGFMDWVRGIFGFLNKNSRPILDVVKMLPIPGASIAADVAENVIPMVDSALSGSSI